MLPERLSQKEGRLDDTRYGIVTNVVFPLLPSREFVTQGNLNKSQVFVSPDGSMYLMRMEIQDNLHG